jgi:outer membrane cobalamin receptor
MTRRALALLLVPAALPALAREGQRGDTIRELEAVTVHGKPVKREIVPVQALGGKALERLGVYSVADAVRYFSGIQVKDYGGIGGLKTVNVRAMGSHHVGVFYDGVELGNAQNGVVDLGRFSLDNMEAIALYNGQKSTILQPAKDYASASAVYMTTRRPVIQAGKRRNVNAGLKGGSFETINPSLLWERRVNERVTASFSAEYLYTSGKYRFSYARKNGYDTTETRRNGDVSMARVELALFGRAGAGEWMAKAYYYNSARGYPGASVREEPGKFKHQDRQWDDNFFAQATWRARVGERYSLLVNGKYARDYLHYLSDPRVDVSTMYVNNRYRQREAYGSAAHLLGIRPWWHAALSNDFQFNTLDADLVHFVYPRRYSLFTAVATAVERDRFKLQASVLHTFVREKTRVTGANAGQKSIFTPSLVVAWQPFKARDLHLRGFYKRVFRMPTLNDLYYTFIGNKDLEPEYTTQYDVGLAYATGHPARLEVQVDAYYNQVENKIIAMPTSNQFRWTMLNLGQVEIRGVDVAVQGSFRAGGMELSPRLSYTYQQARDLTEPGSPWYGGQIPYIPWHAGSVILGGSSATWSWNYSFIYTGERYEAVANIPENHARPWYTHDLSLSKTFRREKHATRVTAEINNIFNQQYEVVQCYPMPGTNFKIKINILL